MEDIIDYAVPPEQAGVEAEDLTVGPPAPQGTADIIPDPLTLVNRASKIDIALGDSSPGADSIVNTIASPGGEASINFDMIMKKNQATTIRNQEDLKQLIKESPFGGITADIATAHLNKDIIRTPVDNKTPVWEAEYARKLLETSVKASGIMEKYGESLAGNDRATGMMDAYQKVTTMRESFRKISENLEAEAKSNSWARSIGNMAITLLPGGSWYSLSRGTLNSDSYLPGSTVDDTIKNIYEVGQRLGPDAATRLAIDTIEKIRAVSPNDARDFAAKLNTFTNSDANLYNVLAITDALVIGDLARPAIRGLSSLAGALSGAVKATGKGALSGVGLLDASGAVQRAALMEAWTNLATKTQNAGVPVTDLAQIERNVLSLSNPVAAVNGGRFLGRAAASRIENAMIERSGDLLGLAGRAVDTGVGSEKVIQTALMDAADTARRLHPNMNHAVVDVRLISAQETVSGFDAAAIRIGKPKLTVDNGGRLVDRPIVEQDIAVTIARKDATPFDTELSARKAATDIYKLKEFDVIQHGSSYVIEVRRPLDLTSNNVKAALEIETKNSTPKGFFSTYFSALRNRDFVNSPQLVKDLKVALYGGSGMQQEFGRLVNQAFGGIKNWRKEDVADFEKFLTTQRDVVVNNKRGKFSRTLGDFETDWMKVHGKIPSEQQAQAYFAYQQFNDLDYVYRNLTEHATRVRQGRELFSFNMDGYKMKKGMIEGKYIKDGIPWHLPENANILVWANNSTEFANANRIPLRTRFASAQTRAAYDDMVRNQGYKVIQISEDGSRNLRSIPQMSAAIGERRFDYILVRDTVNSPLPLQMFPYRPGGHVKYDPEGYVLRQPIIGRGETHAGVQNSFYSGDRSLFHFKDRKEAEVYKGHMDYVRTILNDTKALEAYRQANLGHIFADTAAIRRVFHERGAGFNTTDAFSVTRMDQSVDQAGGLLNYTRSPNDTIINSRDSVHNLDRGRAHTSFTSERDLDMTGIYHGLVEPGRKIDPMATMIQANTDLMRGRYMEDFKVAAAERYVAEFGHLFDGVKNLDEVRQNPLVWLTSDKFKPNANKAEVAAAKNAQFSIRSLLGQKTAFQEYMDTARAGIAESYFHALGDRGYKAVTNVLDIPLIKDPVAFVRAAAFYPKMGFFNPAQLFIQAQTLGVITAAAGPVTATKAMRGYTSMKMASLTNKDNVLDHLASIAGWSPKHFKEALQGIHATGFGAVGREFSDMSDILKQGSVQTRTGRFLDAGLGFFKEGEKVSRYTAWNSAYIEWRTANPAAAFDGKAQASVLKRADDLNVNMSGASDSRVSRTTLGQMILQFTSYQAKLTENVLMGMATGKGAFNRAEATKVAMMQTALYGVPVGLLGATAGVYPWYEQVKEYLFRKGVDANDNSISKALNDGLLGYATELATGTKYNVAERYGSGGISLFKDLLSGDPKQFEKAVLGVGAKNMYDFWKNAQPLMFGLGNATNGNYLLNMEDVQELFKPITTVNSGIKIYYAMNLGKLVTRDEGHFGDITTTEAITGLITGLVPQNIQDSYMKLQWDKDRKAGLKFSEEQATVNFRRGAEALSRGDYDAHEKYNVRAQAFLDATDMTPQERAIVARRAANNMVDLADKIDEKVSKQTPEAYQKWLQRMDRRVRPGAVFDPQE